MNKQVEFFFDCGAGRWPVCAARMAAPPALG